MVSDNDYDLGLLAVLAASELQQRLHGQDDRQWQSFDEWDDQARLDRLRRWGYR